MADITLNTLYGRVGIQSALSTTDYTSSMFLEDVHIITQDIQSDIIAKKKFERNWDIWYTSTVSLQDEYTRPLVSSTTVGTDHIENVSVVYESDTYTETANKKYIPCITASDNQIANWEYYLENQPQDQPIYFRRDNSIFIAPDPRSDEVGTNRLKITGIRSIDSGNWTTSTTEAQTKLPLFMLEVIVLGCVWKANIRDRRDRNVVKDLKAEYVEEKLLAIAKIENQPSISYFNYPNEIESDDIIITTN